MRLYSTAPSCETVYCCTSLLNRLLLFMLHDSTVWLCLVALRCMLKVSKCNMQLGDSHGRASFSLHTSATLLSSKYIISYLCCMPLLLVYVKSTNIIRSGAVVTESDVPIGGWETASISAFGSIAEDCHVYCFTATTLAYSV